ncbi:MAG: hypothetical protein KKH52_01855 [Nanoarchaeota archaeon]|nr:hypothetical protein [Nanoarchaeota archaeon]MBU1622811.1 hypothetical protein [Nanoarchaeota archaeon]MBU1974116.1 hypothetical protein [Nanoarchaeota archaeon]
MNNKNLIDYNESPFSKIIAKKDYINKVALIAQQKCNTVLNTPTSKKINVELRTWKKFLSQEYIKSLTYHRLSKFCGFPKDKIRDGIKLVDDIEAPFLPLNFNSKEGVRLDCGVINEGRIRSRMVEYTNKDKDVLDIIRTAAKKVIGNKFIPSERLDVRDQTICLSFPPLFAKHFLKLGIEGNKNFAPIKIPNYILNNKEHCKIWWRGNISEEASIYAFSSPKNGVWYIVPRIQINRVNSVNFFCNFPAKERTYYHKDIPKKFLEKLKSNIPQLMLDEAKMLKYFGINVKPFFSKLYINKKGQQTATYTILLSNLNNLKKYHHEVGFELERHKKQFELLLFNRGPKNEEEIRRIMIEFYKLVPKYLRRNKKIKVNKWLKEEDRVKLLS